MDMKRQLDAGLQCKNAASERAIKQHCECKKDANEVRQRRHKVRRARVVAQLRVDKDGPLVGDRLKRRIHALKRAGKSVCSLHMPKLNLDSRVRTGTRRPCFVMTRL